MAYIEGQYTNFACYIKRAYASPCLQVIGSHIGPNARTALIYSERVHTCKWTAMPRELMTGVLARGAEFGHREGVRRI